MLSLKVRDSPNKLIVWMRQATVVKGEMINTGMYSFLSSAQSSPDARIVLGLGEKRCGTFCGFLQNRIWATVEL